MHQEREALFRSWIRDHAGLIFRISRSFAPDEADRQDLSQEILFQAKSLHPRKRELEQLLQSLAG